jgi:hypothetical protein
MVRGFAQHCQPRRHCGIVRQTSRHEPRHSERSKGSLRFSPFRLTRGPAAASRLAPRPSPEGEKPKGRIRSMPPASPMSGPLAGEPYAKRSFCRGRLPAESAWRARSERLAPLLVLRTRPSEPLMPALGGLKGDHQGRPYIRPCGQRLRRGNPSSGDFVTSSGQALRFALDDGVCWVAGARSRSPSPQAMVDAAKMPHAPPMARNRDPRPGTSGEGGRSAAGKHGPRDPSGRRTSGTEAGHARRQSPLRC